MTRGFEGKVRHGTPSGWRTHQEMGEQPCDPCYRAKAAYDVRRREAPEVARKARDAAKAQNRATMRMRRMFPEVWAALYAEEKAKISDVEVVES